MLLDPQWIKVINDLWDNKARTLLVVLAIAVGVFSFGGVFMSREVIIDDMNDQYAAINPASINIWLSPFDESLIRAVESIREVENAAGQAAMSVKALTPDGPINLNLYALEDYDHIIVNQLIPEEGSYPPRRREVILERASVAIAGVVPGDMLQIELPDGQTRELETVGILHDLNALPATMWPQLSGYVSMETLQWLGHSGQYSKLSITTTPEIRTRLEAEEVAQGVKERIERYGFQVSTVETMRPGEHWAEETTKGVILILAVLGGFALSLSAFLVVNTTTALLAQHKRQIGMLKAVGATGAQVVSFYMALVTAFGILALFLALPLGTGLAYIVVVAVTGFLNIDIINFHMPLWVAGMMIAAALFAPLAAGLVPIIGGARVTVREALSDYGINNQKQQGFLDRMLARIRRMPRPVMLSLRNTFRRKGRLFLTLGTLILAGSMFIAVLSVRQAMFFELDRALQLWGFDVSFEMGADYPVRSLEREAQRIDDVAAVEGVTTASSRRLRDDDTEGATIWLVGVSPQSQFVRGQTLIEEGRWLQPDDKNAVVLSTEVIKNEPGIHIGDEITLEINGLKRKWVVIGIVNTLGDTTGYVNFDYLARLKGTPGQANRFFVGTSVHDATTQDRVAEEVEERMKRAGMMVGYTETGHVITDSNAAQFDFLVAFLLGAAIILAIVGGLGLAGTMSLNVLERTREIGVMRSVGASNGSIRRIVLTEGVTIGMISWVVGIALSVPFTYVFGVALGAAVFGFPLTFTFSTVAVLIWLPLVLVISIISSLLPARRAARISVRAALTYE